MVGLFHDDATFQFGKIKGDWKIFIDKAKAIVNPMTSTHHQIGNILFDFKGDVAKVETYCTATHIIPADYPENLPPFHSLGKRYVCTIGLRYIDRFEKRSGEWRIAARVGVYDWRQDMDLNDGGIFDGPSEILGQHGHNDPSTAIVKAWRNI